MSQDTPANTPTEHTKSGVSTFVGGFTVGVLFGVAGYYLFGTKQGKAVRNLLTEEWQLAERSAHLPVGEAHVSKHWQSAFSRLAKELGFNRRRQASVSGKVVRQSAFIKKNRPHKKPSGKFSGI